MGTKFDDGKITMDLILPEFELELGRVMTHGAAVHGKYEFLEDDPEPLQWSQVYAAMKRHSNAFWTGESMDVDDFHHLAAVAANAMMLYTLEQYGRGTDDRPYRYIREDSGVIVPIK